MKARCITLFDITATGTRGNINHHAFPLHDRTGKIISDIASWNRSRNQQRNFDTVLQVLSLRMLPELLSDPQRHDRADQRFWTFEFFTTRDDAFDLIFQDCQAVPMITGLDETTDLEPQLVPGSNLFFEQIVDK